ncbi:endo alpha-1,4 polygalactosaminidase [Nonomuraea fuscirosea]|uniref:endo alpha-1,4 polygalactosaminidase n=1 Tax=Nonomuraea fuscirosea TaxID=1291556 RepID=UPI002DDA68DF|nr:endo alpha-1,4 polygalactosaminidase [Nonomuraea fuscirosea]WSA47820.1 endo alpha-1,4 polygalactosaminidase [Nonomuraea fuscirosea]
MRLSALVSAAALAAVTVVTSLTTAPAAAGSASGAALATASGAAALPSPVACNGCWKPALNTSWDWQLIALPKKPYPNVQMFDIDGFDATDDGTIVKSLKADKPGRRVVCYISAGTYEDWRPDSGRFPAAVLGDPLEDWEGERWLDIRRYSGELGQIMKDRLDMCKAAGFDAVEPDNVDGYTNDTGFPLKAADQLAYNAWLANEAHKRGLSVALKNDVAQIPQLLPYFDFAINEECWEHSECTTAQNGGSYGYDQFVKAGKAVFQVEYNLATSKFCSKSNAQNFNSLKKTYDLDSYRVACR